LTDPVTYLFVEEQQRKQLLFFKAAKTVMMEIISIKVTSHFQQEIVAPDAELPFVTEEGFV